MTEKPQYDLEYRSGLTEVELNALWIRVKEHSPTMYEYFTNAPWMRGAEYDEQEARDWSMGLKGFLRDEFYYKEKPVAKSSFTSEVEFDLKIFSYKYLRADGLKGKFCG
jgi:hypothetical protein